MGLVRYEDGSVILRRSDIRYAQGVKLDPLPIGRSGRIEIRHLLIEGKRVPFYDERIIYDHAFDYMIEHPENGRAVQSGKDYITWMSATPQEMVDLIPPLQRFKSGGRIFMSGLGIGLVPRLLTHMNKEASRFVVVEQSQEVIDLVWPYIRKDGYVVVNNDVGNVLDGIIEQFDLVILDTWPSGDYVFLPWVETLAGHAGRLLGKRGELWLWQYDFMVRRLRKELHDISDMVTPAISQEKLAGIRRKWPFFSPFAEWLAESPRLRAEVSKRIKEEVYAFRRGEREGLHTQTSVQALTNRKEDG